MDNLALLLQAPPLALQLVIDGVLIGSVFALAAYGMALVWGVMNIINVCQGEFVMLGGYVALYLARAGLQPLLGVPVAAAALFPVGWLCYRLVIFRIVEQDLFVSLLATFGLGILLSQVMNQVFGANVQSLDPGLGSWFLFQGLVSVSIMIWTVQPFGGLIFTVRSFMIVILAGLGNLPGVILAALGLGVAEQFVGFILGAQLQIAFVFLALVAILVLRSRWLHRQRRYLA